MRAETGKVGGGNDELMLGVLSAVDADARISQRDLSRELGVALGLANAYLKRCVRKGYIKMQQMPRRRYAYYLTPHGLTEKARLTGEYLTSSLQFFRRARTQIGRLMADCDARGWRNIALAGASEIAEIATLTAHHHDVRLVGIVDPSLGRDRFCGLPVTRTLAEFGHVDAVIVTRIGADDGLTASLEAALGRDRVLTPDLIRLAHVGGARRRARIANGGQS